MCTTQVAEAINDRDDADDRLDARVNSRQNQHMAAAVGYPMATRSQRVHIVSAFDVCQGVEIVRDRSAARDQDAGDVRLNFLQIRHNRKRVLEPHYH